MEYVPQPETPNFQGVRHSRMLSAGIQAEFRTGSSRWKFQAVMTSFACSARSFCYFFSVTKIFGLRIFVLTHDLEVTLLSVLPFSGRISYWRSSVSIL